MLDFMLTLITNLENFIRRPGRPVVKVLIFDLLISKTTYITSTHKETVPVRPQRRNNIPGEFKI